MNQLVNQKSAMPTRKLTWATVAAVGSSMAADLLIEHVDALAVLNPEQLETFIVGVVTLSVGYMVRDRRNA